LVKWEPKQNSIQIKGKRGEFCDRHLKLSQTGRKGYLSKARREQNGRGGGGGGGEEKNQMRDTYLVVEPPILSLNWNEASSQALR
jgi:hypothetical protein